MPARFQLQNNRLLLLIWICFLLRGIFYSVLFPLWEGYDEYPHFAFVQYMAAHHTLPAANVTPISREVQASLELTPLPWAIRDLGLPHEEYWKLPEQERRRRQEQLQSLSRDEAGWPITRTEAPSGGNIMNWEAQQPPLYYWLMTYPLELARNTSLMGRVLLLRLLSVGLASFVVPLGFWIAHAVVQSREAALGVVAVAAVMPELMIDVCRVSNDSLAVLFYALLIYCTVRLLEAPVRTSVAALLAVSLGLGLLTKAYFLTALPALVVVVGLHAWRESSARMSVVCKGAAALAAALCISGWWYWRNHTLTGTWSGVMAEAEAPRLSIWEFVQQIPRVDWRNGLESVLISHIWFGNWSFLQVRSWIYHGFRYVVPLALIGLVIIFVSRSRRNARLSFISSRKNLLVVMAFYGFFWLGLLYHILLTFLAHGISASQGWYLYCLVTAEVLLTAAGLMAVLPERLQRWVLPAAASGFGLLDLYTVHFLLAPYYVGLTGHRAGGGLASFGFGQLRGLNLWEYLGRLVATKPFISVPEFLATWFCYLCATIGLVTMTFRLTRLRRPKGGAD